MPKQPSKLKRMRSQAGFSLIELIMVCAILGLIMGAIMRGVWTTTVRSQSEQTKVDLTQGGREFIDEFERDVHQAGYPSCKMIPTAGVTQCIPDLSTASGQSIGNNASIAVGIASISNTKIILEGDVDGNGTVDSVQYILTDASGNNPPASCPCIVKRSQVAKVGGTSPLSQTTSWSQELDNVVNSGVPTGTTAYGNGVSITGTTAWGATNTSYYASLTTFKDYPVFQAYDQNGNIIALPLDISTTAGAQTLTCAPAATQCLRSVRITINLLASATTGIDLQTKVRPVTTLVGSSRLVNNNE